MLASPHILAQAESTVYNLPSYFNWVFGLLLVVGGNGVVAVAEQYVDSGLAALLIASTPLWVVSTRPSRSPWSGCSGAGSSPPDTAPPASSASTT